MGQEHRADLVIRNLRLQRMFACIDHFLSPSLFSNSAMWPGEWIRIGSAWLRTCRCGQIATSLSLRLTDVRKELVLGFFGQINPWKGIDLIIEAVAMARVQYPQLRLEIHGCSWADLGDDRSILSGVCDAAQGLLEPIGLSRRSSCVVVMSPISSARMAGVDLVVMGSTWYNAPMVIQEAFCMADLF